MKVLLLSLVASSFGCSAAVAKPDELPPYLRHFVIRTESNPNVAPPATATFAWSRGEVLEDHPTVVQEYEVLIRSLIAKELRELGHRENTPEQANLLVSFVAAYVPGLDAEARAVLGVRDASSWQPSDMSLGQGSIIVQIDQARPHLTLWVGQIGGLATLELTRDLRHARVAEAVHELMARFAATRDA